MPKIQKSLDLNGQRATNSGDASAATDLTTLQQVQNLIRGLNEWKDDVRGTSTGNLAITSLINGLTHDGVTYATGDSILLKNQTAPAENGIYTIGASGTGVRRTDADTSAEVTRGMTVTVLEGTTKGTGGSQANPITYVLTTSGVITLGTTGLTFATVGGAGGGSAPVAGIGIDVSGSTVDIEPGYRARGFAANCAATTNPQSFAHGFGTADYTFVVKEGNVQVFPDITADATNITVDWGGAPTASQYRVIATAVV